MVLDSLNEAIANLEAASDGVSMRTALVDLAETLSSMEGGDTEKLGEKGPGDYVLLSDIESVRKQIKNILTYDTLPSLDSVGKVIKNKDITEYFGGILEDLKSINGDKKGDYSKADPADIGNNIKECLTVLNNNIGKYGAMEDAINEKATGESSHVQPTDSIEDYPKRINNIQLAVLDIQPYLVTEDGDHKESDIVRDQEGNILSGHAYNPVTVDVKLKGQDAILRNTGNNTPDEGYDGFSSVTLDVDGAIGGSGGSGGSGSGSGYDGLPTLTDITITENGDYPRPANYDGYENVDVQVTKFELPEEEELTVKFITDHDDGSSEVLDTTTVLTGENAVYKGPTPQYEVGDNQDDGYYFNYWSPDPSCVIDNMECKAVYGKADHHDGSYWINDTDYCKASWQEIFTGKVNPVGTVKPIKVRDGSYIMVYFGALDTSKHAVVCSCLQRPPLPIDLPAPDPTQPWESSQLFSYLNGDFLTQYLPSWLVEHIPTISYGQYVPIVDDANKFNNISPSSLLGTGHREYDKEGHITRTYIKYDGPNGGTAPVVGLKHQGGNSQVWIPSATELGVFKNYKGDFTDDIYHNTTFTWDNEPKPPFGTYSKIGMKSNPNYPKTTQIGLVQKGEELSDLNMFHDYLIFQKKDNIPDVKTMQGWYGPNTISKNTDPRDVYTNTLGHNKIGDGFAVYGGDPNPNEILIHSPTRWQQGGQAGSILLRDRIISSCTLINEQWGEPEEHWVTDPDTGERWLYSITQKIDHSNWDINYSLSYCCMSVNGCFASDTGSSGVYPCFALEIDARN